MDSVEEALSQAVDRTVPEDREARRREWATALAALRGDFARADESAHELARTEATNYDTRDLGVEHRVNLALERGEPATAASLAAAYLRRRGAFALPTFDADPTPLLLDAERRGGAMTPADLRTRMERWRADWKTRLSGQVPPDLWTVGEAHTVETAEELAQAIAARPPLDRLSALFDPGAVGRVSLLAGRDDEAEPLLARAARSCFVFDGPFEVVRASLHLGLAREDGATRPARAPRIAASSRAGARRSRARSPPTRRASACARFTARGSGGTVGRRFVIGTAGHVDHGKTTLVRALTGVDTDRLPEERRRGISIELGFAPLDLGEGLAASVVDVPGHRRLVRAMIAGASGIELVLLVVAADEGVMPQTREHVAVCELLGLQRAVVAITKADAVDAELAQVAGGGGEGAARRAMDARTSSRARRRPARGSTACAMRSVER